MTSVTDNRKAMPALLLCGCEPGYVLCPEKLALDAEVQAAYQGAVAGLRTWDDYEAAVVRSGQHTAQ